MRLLNTASCLLVMILALSCSSLKPISDASEKSQASLELFEQMPITYTAFCDERCRFNLIRRSEVIRDTDIDCDCSLFKEADKATVKVHKTVTAYFKSLGTLSKGNLTTYQTKALSEALVEGNFGSLTIDKKTATAYSSLTNLILFAVTDNYRKKKLATFIGNGNAPLQTLLSLLQTSVGNLVKEIDFQKERNFALHSELLKEEHSGYEKLQLTSGYYGEINKLSIKQEQLKTFAKSLVSIGKGHQKLYDNRNKLTAKEIRELMADYTADLQDLIVDFKKSKS